MTEKVLPKGHLHPPVELETSADQRSTELLINLKPVWTRKAADGRPRLVLTPDRIMHPRFTESLPGKGGYVICRRDAVEHFRDKRACGEARRPREELTALGRQIGRAHV